VRVLGIDPGLTRCGIGVVDGPVVAPTIVHASCAATPADLAIESRLLRVHDAIASVIEEHRPDIVAVERVLFQVNVRSAMATGQAAGVALLAAARAGLPVVAYSPNEVKAAVAGWGGADKAAVARLVTAQLRLEAAPTPVDVTDALAVALTHLGHARLGSVASRADGRRSATGTAGGWDVLLDNPNLVVRGGTNKGARS